MGSFDNVVGSIQFQTDRRSLNRMYQNAPSIINYDGMTPSSK